MYLVDNIHDTGLEHAKVVTIIHTTVRKMEFFSS